ncbi:MAG: hypothetical protein RL136_358 [Planctomycetota bacterium]|jgi:YHS domain-containing protein
MMLPAVAMGAAAAFASLAVETNDGAAIPSSTAVSTAVSTTASIAVSLPPVIPPLPEHQPAAERPLFPFDPVILIGTGERLEGAPERESVYGSYRYRFATDASKRAFDAVPSRFAIAFGGGCGRMGPLSGAGDVGRFDVFGEKIYIFASDACRDSFMKSPESFMEATDAPFPTDARGLELAALARRWLRADAACPKEIVVSGTRDERVGGGDYRVREEVRLGQNLAFTDFSSWNDDAWWTIAEFGGSAVGAKPLRAKRSNAQPEQPLDDSQFEAFRRMAMLEPLFLARVLVQPDVKLSSGGSEEWQVGEQRLGGEVLKVHWNGVTVEWLLKPATGQPVAQRAMQRARDMRFERVTEAFAEWSDHAGVRIPLVRTDGTRTRRYDTVETECDPEPDETTGTRPGDGRPTVTPPLATPKPASPAGVDPSSIDPALDPVGVDPSGAPTTPGAGPD